MSVNKVTLNDSQIGDIPFILIPGEIVKFASSTKRQSLVIHSDSSPIKISANDGHVFVTTKRLIFITASSGDINSFSIEFQHAPLLQFSHKMKAPWFGANYYEFLFFSTKPYSDGFPKDWFKGEIKFNEGGLYEFVDVVNKCLNDAVNNNEIDDELPAYQQ